MQGILGISKASFHKASNSFCCSWINWTPTATGISPKHSYYSKLSSQSVNILLGKQLGKKVFQLELGKSQRWSICFLPVFIYGLHHQNTAPSTNCRDFLGENQGLARHRRKSILVMRRWYRRRHQGRSPVAERCPSMHNAVGLIPNTTKRTKNRWSKTELVTTSHIVQQKATLNTGEGSQGRLIKGGEEIIHRSRN